MKNILLVFEHFWPHVGGAEVIFKELALGLSEKGLDVKVVTSKLKGYKKYEELLGVKIFRTCSNRYSFTFFSIFEIYKHAKNADVIYTTTFNAAFPAWLVGKILRKKIILIVLEVWGRGFWKKVPGFTLLHWLFEEFIMFLPFDKYIAISKSTKNHMVSLYKKDDSKIDVIYPGISNMFYDAKREKKVDDKDDFYFLYFGRPGFAKGVEVLIDAFSKLEIDVKLKLILSKTPKSMYKIIMKKIYKLNDSKIQVVESLSRESLVSEIKKANCVIVPSLREGFGFSAVETCALGVPLICSEVDSLPEVVFGDVIFFEPGNSDDLVKVMNDAKDGKFEKIPKKEYSWEEMVEEYIGVINNVL